MKGNKKIIVGIMVMAFSNAPVHADFTSWIQKIFGIQPINKNEYELTRRGYRRKNNFQSSPEGVRGNDSRDPSNMTALFHNRQDPYQMSSPPFRAPVGSIWVKKGFTWKLVSNEEFVEEKQAEIRNGYADVLGARLPIKKSIYVYNLDDGQETMLRANENYSIQVSGYGPRESIRIKVYDSSGNELPGDFITISNNVTEGTEKAIADQALKAIEEIRDAGDITPFCRTDSDYGVVADAVVEEDIDDYAAPDVSARPVARPTQRLDDYKEGCEALADGITSGDAARLKVCANTLLSFVNGGTRNMCQKLDKIFSLNEQEQDFIGMLMATKAEAPGGLAGGSADHLMIMKSLDNRRAAVRRRGWAEPISIADIAFQFDQYSAFNDHNNDNQFDAPGFLRNSGYEKLVDSFVAFHSAEWRPPGVIDNVTHYYSPPAMIPRNSTPSWVRSGIRNNGAREVTSEIRVNGQPVVNSRNSSHGYHKFYVGIDGRNNYNASRDTRRQIIDQCRY